jgi:hypothetical protein
MLGLALFVAVGTVYGKKYQVSVKGNDAETAPFRAVGRVVQGLMREM